MNVASNEYLRSAVLTASPEQLHLMLYDGAIRFTRLGIDGIEKKNWEDAFNGFSRAQKIVLEMLNSLNFDVDEHLCKRMASLYTFIYKKLVEASVKRDAGMGREALDLLDYQRETWTLLIEKVGELRTQAESESADTTHERVETLSSEAAYGSISFEG